MAEKDAHIRVLNESGFPLQIALEHLVRTTAPGGWRMRYSEHAWRGQSDAQAGFIDLVVQNQYDTAVMVVECKRVYDASWLFLSSQGTARSRAHCKGWVSHCQGNSFKFFGWEDFSVDPQTPEASFCAIRDQDANGRRPMLERIASEVVASTEALALQERSLHIPPSSRLFRMYFNVIVTTAPLLVAHFEPAKISLAEGILEGASFTEVPFLRFRKQLLDASTPAELLDYQNGAVAGSRESTVFIVNAEHFAEFLREFEVSDQGARKFM
ncbi:hypothetical protein QTI51_37365 [Variovorax sp. J22G73]|uniref:hypothetical protein n=1 Tax=unclassified Variovorax TaxID=663243 RepID=UPI002577F363|nr:MULTISPECIES: hypothetical protein [unclassified Variovorax]MDM0010142.1 hypothetical protein [Variovorax sp. J22R203]MDM0102996.1 hypothetical protein [Variovorax sp. J22G73]